MKSEEHLIVMPKSEDRKYPTKATHSTEVQKHGMGIPNTRVINKTPRSASVQCSTTTDRLLIYSFSASSICFITFCLRVGGGLGFLLFFFLQVLFPVLTEAPQLEAKTHPKSRNTKKTPRLHEHFRKVRVNFCLLPCDASQEPNANCSEKRVQMNSVI